LESPSKSPVLTEPLPYASSALLFLSAAVLLLAAIQLGGIPFRLTAPEKGAAVFAAPVASPEIPPFENLSRDFETHSLFYVPKEVVAVQGPGLSEMIKSFQLIGIVQGEKPEALIKNVTTQQTYFARQGEKFDRFTVAEITQGSIKVEFQGESAELLLEGGNS